MNPLPAKPSITVVHSLPGRVRMRLSHPLTDSQALPSFLREHAGMGAIAYTAATDSLLVQFDPHAISSAEITLRTAFRYALDQGRPVRLLAAPERVALQNSAILSGICVASALAARWLHPQATRSSMERLASLGTGLSVLDHGWRELRTRGYFDPEVLALVYLLASLLRGNALSAAAVTWLATFGRHLVEMPATGVQVEAYARPVEQGQDPRYEIVVGPDADAPDRLRLGLASLLNAGLRYAMTGGGAHGLRTLWEELRDVSQVHGEILEGYGRQHGGIPIHFR
ncbi:MAG: hypothetical protein U1E05_02115 [Patescibacteria group bacterium]|nr:hypothetical protein [Patescibacteria group bacterium]